MLVHGVKIGLRATQPDILDHITPVLPPGWKPVRADVVHKLYSIIAGGADPASRVRRFHMVYSDYVRIARTMDLADMWRHVARDVSLWTAMLAPHRVFLHAGVVGWRGRALLLPGRTLAGKSTLVAALVKQGATYYSDEWAVLDAQGRVHPFARPLSIRHPADQGGGESSVSVESIGGRAGKSPLPVGLVVMTNFDPRKRWAPRPLSAAEGALAMVEHAVQMDRDPPRVLGTLRQIVSRAPVLASARSQADDVVADLLGRLDSAAAHRVGARP